MSNNISSPKTIAADLIKKYQGAAPRYTSYPTAPNFTMNYREEHYKTQVRESNEVLLPRDLSLYVHIPFCHSLCYFCGCNKFITQHGNAKVDNYLGMLLKEIDMRAELFDQDRRVTQIHFGGGTPNFLDNKQLRKIFEKITNRFRLDRPSKLEIGIEIDPRSTDAAGIRELADIGFNRFSIGIQDFSSDVQLAINRVQSEESTLKVIQAAMNVSTSVNVDLISGLPKQTLKGFSNTLEKIIDSGVTRIAAYNFAYLPQKIKAQKLIDPTTLPGAHARTELAEAAQKILTEAGYVHIGLDHFASPDDTLAKAQVNDTLQRNFQGYTTHAETDLIGLGVSAISHSKNSFAQNATTLSKYSDLIRQNVLPIYRGYDLSDDDVLRAELIQQIMCKKSVKLDGKVRSLVNNNADNTLNDYFSAELHKLKPFTEDGLITRTENGFQISEQGAYFRRQIAAEFDRYLPHNIGGDASSSHTKSNVVQFSQAL